MTFAFKCDECGNELKSVSDLTEDGTCDMCDGITFTVIDLED